MVECVIGGAGLVALELIARGIGVVADRRASRGDARIAGGFDKRGDRSVVRWADCVFILYRRSGFPKCASGDGSDDRRGAWGDLFGIVWRTCCIVHRRMERGMSSPMCTNHRVDFDGEPDNKPENKREEEQFQR